MYCLFTVGPLSDRIQGLERDNRLCFPNGYGATLTVVSDLQTFSDHSRSVGVGYECYRLRSDYVWKFSIIDLQIEQL